MAMFLDRIYNELIKCPTCGIYVNSEEMDTHLVSHATALRWGMTISPLSSPSSPSVLIPSDPIPQPHCPICNKNLKAKKKNSQKIQLVSHIKIHIQVNCILCSSKIRLDNIGEHFTACIVSHNASVSCPICNHVFQTVKAAKKHLEQHISDFFCPYPDCSSPIELKKFDEHIRMHLRTEDEKKVQSPSQEKPDNSEDIEHSQSLCCPICSILIVHDVFLDFPRNKRKFVNHMKRHIEVLCSLCSATIRFNYFGTHTNACRFSNGAASVCPICNSPLTERKPSKHFREHVPHFCCPFPHCSMFLKYDMVKSHIETHFNKIIIPNPSTTNTYAPQSEVPTQCRGPTTAIISTMHFQCNLCGQAMSEDSDQHICLYPVNTDSPVSDFLCPFCDTKHSGNIDLISSHLLSCVNIPSDLQIIALPNLVGFRLN